MAIGKITINGQNLYSSTRVGDIIPYSKGKKAVEDCGSGYKMLYDEAKELVRSMATVDLPVKLETKINSLPRTIEKECEEKLSDIRAWATESMDEMKATAPVMTGNLRDSIRYIGTGPDYINVGIDPEEIARGGRRKNIVPYYNGSAPGNRNITLPDYDYSDYADKIARSSNKGEGGPFKYSTWYRIKQDIAYEYDLEYTFDPNFDEES